MLIPSEFARLAVIHGTVGTVSDPHEIANVLGIDGVKFMIENGNKVPFKFNFGAPSCVPAMPFETAGASLGLEETEALLKMDEIRYLSEMMNFPGFLGDDLAAAVNLLVEAKGGIACVCDGKSTIMTLAVAGIMSDQNAWDVARFYALLDQKAKFMGSKLRAPFMTLSFMALLVIPAIKLSDKGLFDGNSFTFTSLMDVNEI